MLDTGSKSPIGIAQRVFGRPSVGLRMLPNIGPTFLQRGMESQGCGAAGSGTPGNGKGGCLVSRGRHFAGGVRGGPDNEGPDMCEGGGPNGRVGLRERARIG